MTPSEVEKKFMKAVIGGRVDYNYYRNDDHNDYYWNEEDDYYYRRIFNWSWNWTNTDNTNDYYYDNDANICNQCEQKTTSPYWCRPCNSSNFKKEFDSWESGNNNVDAFIRDAQLKATSSYKILEWIPYSKLKNTTYLAEGGFGKVYSAEWSEGYILYWNPRDSQWKRKGTTEVALKCLSDSQNITKELLNEIRNLYNCNGQTSFITRCYGITRHDETNNLMIVMQLMKDDSLRRNLTKLREMSWKEKFICLSRIAEGLSQMHSVGLVHQDFHTGNILLSSISNNTPYIADLGLNKPAEGFTENRRKVYGVLPYVAPEVLRGEKYTKAADVYAFGVIMSEVISGIIPFKNVPHNKHLVTRICNGERPKVPKNTPALVIELMQRCWDGNPMNRLSSHEIRNILRTWRDYFSNTELGKQIKESENMAPDSVDDSEIHPGAFYKSRCLTDELEL